MAHQFDVSQRSKLDSPKRREILPPEETLLKLGLQAGEIMADIGCGIGYFTFPAARIVGPEGKVYALDVSPEMLSDVETRKNQDNIHNIEVVKVDEYNLSLEAGSVTVGFVSNVLHEIDDLERFLVEIRRVLNVRGKLFIIEWEKRVSDFGPPIAHRLSRDDLKRALENQGFEDIQFQGIGTEFYAVITKKI